MLCACGRYHHSTANLGDVVAVGAQNSDWFDNMVEQRQKYASSTEPVTSQDVWRGELAKSPTSALLRSTVAALLMAQLKTTAPEDLTNLLNSIVQNFLDSMSLSAQAPHTAAITYYYKHYMYCMQRYLVVLYPYLRRSCSSASRTTSLRAWWWP